MGKLEMKNCGDADQKLHIMFKLVFAGWSALILKQYLHNRSL